MPTVSGQAAATQTAITQAVIDCDVHATVPSTRALFPYLSDFWRETIEQTGFKGATDNYYPVKVPTSTSREAQTPNGIRPGSELAHVQEAVLGRGNVELAIVNNAYAGLRPGTFWKVPASDWTVKRTRPAWRLGTLSTPLHLPRG